LRSFDSPLGGAVRYRVRLLPLNDHPRTIPFSIQY
jgi:hypothetical protein